MDFPPFTTDKFEPGETFWSPDLKTWVRGAPPPVIVKPGDPVITVTGVARERGIITVESQPDPVEQRWAIRDAIKAMQPGCNGTIDFGDDDK